ncbi:MAG TPA: hypothetical protein VM934_01260 [Pyrinomonadaceae bacterium]|nr:hypothetical protein [Pyrinomonadaceae bacterium]
MITGFNTDIQYEDVTYHVQTEDKGLETPLILSLVYVGGAILASKRTLYQDLIEAGFDEKLLTERLQRQHKLICAAIRAGRIEDLKRMSERDSTARTSPAAAPPPPSPPQPTTPPPPSPASVTPSTIVTPSTVAPPFVFGDDQYSEIVLAQSQPFAPSEATTEQSEDSVAVGIPDAAPAHASLLENGETALVLEEENFGAPDDEDEEIYLTLLEDDGEFRAGQLATIKIHVGRGQYGKSALANAGVTIKVLGTTFRPLILTTKTDEEGIAVVRAMLPRFTSGRAAIIIRASVGDDASELRRIIHQS